MLKLVNLRETPPDNYRYTFLEDGQRIESFGHQSWLDGIKEHYKRNGYPMPDNWRELAEDQLCRLLPPGWCIHEDGRRPEHFIDSRLSVWDIMRGTQVLAAFVLSGGATVSKELAESRAVTCAACPFNMGVAGCAPCIGLSNVIADASGSIETKADDQLRSCAICKCSNRAQSRIPIKHLAKGVTDEMMDQFPEWCWKKKEMLASKT